MGTCFLMKQKREEDNYIYCKIVQQDENSDMQISFPDGKKQWIERKDEEISEDGNISD